MIVIVSSSNIIDTHVYIYIYIYIYIYTYIYTYTHIRICMMSLGVPALCAGLRGPAERPLLLEGYTSNIYIYIHGLYIYIYICISSYV